MGNNRLVSKLGEYAKICREHEGCGCFVYDQSRTFSMNCATYNESNGCADDNNHPTYTAYRIVNFLYFHYSHCASRLMDNNILVSTVDECAIIRREREGCGYFAYDQSRTFSTNCAIYNESLPQI